MWLIDLLTTSTSWVLLDLWFGNYNGQENTKNIQDNRKIKVFDKIQKKSEYIYIYQYKSYFIYKFGQNINEYKK